MWMMEAFPCTLFLINTFNQNFLWWYIFLISRISYCEHWKFPKGTYVVKKNGWKWDFLTTVNQILYEKQNHQTKNTIKLRMINIKVFQLEPRKLSIMANSCQLWVESFFSCLSIGGMDNKQLLLLCLSELKCIFLFEIKISFSQYFAWKFCKSLLCCR